MTETATRIREQLLQEVDAGRLPEAGDLKPVLFSDNSKDAAFAFRLVGLRLAKAGKTERAVQFLLSALYQEDMPSLETVRIMESICGPREYAFLYQALLRLAEAWIACREHEAALEALNYCLHLAVYPSVADAQEKNSLYQKVLAVYQALSRAMIQSAGSRHPGKQQGKMRIAYVLPRLVDEWSPVKLLNTFVKYHDYQRFEVFVYTTEQDVRSKAARFAYSCFKQPSREISSDVMRLLKERGISCFLSDYDLGIAERVQRLTDRMRNDRIDAAVYYGNNMCCIDALLAHLWPAPVQINIDIGTPLFIPALDAVCQGTRQLADSHKEFWDTLGVKVHHMPSGVDSESASAAACLGQFGIPEGDRVVLVTCSSQLPTRMSRVFLETVSLILKAHPGAYYLVVGQGEVEDLKKYFADQGIVDRVKFTGHQKDVPSVLKAVDIYLNEFPEGGGLTVLEAMACAKPVAAVLSNATTATGSAGAYYVGEECAIAGEPIQEKYISYVSALIDSPSLRAQTGERLKSRYHREFSPEKTVRAYEELMSTLYRQKGAGS